MVVDIQNVISNEKSLTFRNIESFAEKEKRQL